MKLETAKKILALPMNITLGVIGGIAEFFLWVGQLPTKAETLGNFHLPKAMAPLFFPALYISTLATAIAAAILLHAETQGPATQISPWEKGVKLAPGLLAAATGGALLLTPLLYYGSGGVAMIGNFLKRMEEKSRNPENVVKLREARQEIADKDEALAQKDEALTQKDEALAERDHVIERQQQEIKELRDRLSTNGHES